MNGFLNLNKPQNFTSHDCVAKLRKILQTRKIGHGGTLDPSATGVLPIAVGKATRLLQFLPTKKGYRGKIQFGIVTNTDDLEGEIISEQSCPDLTLDEIKPHLSYFQGKIEQVPSAFSAIKKDGKKLYELARAGKVVEVPSREVEIYQLEIIDWQAGEFPILEIEVQCSAGTYIRSIARDLGAKVGTGATLAGLNRTLSCGLNLNDSLTFEQIINLKNDDRLSLIPLDQPLQNLSEIQLDETTTQRWCYGQKIIINDHQDDGFYRTYNHNREFIGITEKYIQDVQNLIKAKVMLA